MSVNISFSGLRNMMSHQISRWDDHRNIDKTSISLHDIVMSAFACMFYQSPSLLQFQKELEDQSKNSNLHTQFGVKKIPSNTQLKDVLDEVDSNKFEVIFNKIHKKLLNREVIKSYKNNLDTYFISADGTQYYTSQQVHCKKCLVINRENGKHYSHQILQSAIVLPGKKTVLPLMPTEISNSTVGDSTTKQDCERKSFIRQLKTIKKTCLELPFTFLLDSLFATEPDVKAIKSYGWDFIIVSKPAQNKYLHKEFSLVTNKKSCLEYDDGKYIHKYSWSNNLSINSSRKSTVNFVYYEMVKKQGNTRKTVYKSSWITSHEITPSNVKDIVLGGRARWKIENECFNNLKNQGYHLEHSYGHGENNLSFNFIIITLLSFYIHQLLESQDEDFIACRKKFGSKRYLWQTLKSYINILIFDTFENILKFSLCPELFLDKNILQSARDGPLLANA